MMDGYALFRGRCKGGVAFDIRVYADDEDGAVVVIFDACGQQYAAASWRAPVATVVALADAMASAVTSEPHRVWPSRTGSLAHASGVWYGIALGVVVGPCATAEEAVAQLKEAWHQ